MIINICNNSDQSAFCLLSRRFATGTAQSQGNDF